MSTIIRYLGHAGFIVEHAAVRILIDPWFYPAFLQSWFPYPDNRGCLDQVAGQRFDYLYVSHTHEDHFDVRLLETLDRSTTVLVPKYRSNALLRRFKQLGFTHLVPLDHRQSHEIAPGLTATIFLDTSHKEDSGLLLELDGFRFLDLNDCNTPMSELPTSIDLLAAQYSGAMWYPNCYDYPADVMAQKVKEVRDGLMDTLLRKVRLTGARAYLPSAGPACFLDPALESYNDPHATIFPQWNDVSAQFEHEFPGRTIRAHPGDTIHVDTNTRSSQVEAARARRTDEDLGAYRERRRDEWSAFYAEPDTPIAPADIERYLATLQRRNKPFLRDFQKDLRLVAGGTQWGVHLGRLSENFVIESEEPFDPEYTFVISPRVLRAILEGRTGWEEALLSMRIRLHRDPDVFDLQFMSLLRYGNEPAQIMHMVRERQSGETIERDGLRMQRFCPHAGEDLTHATICDGVVECPRHHWRWSAWTGECLSGGTVPLKVEVLDPTRDLLQPEGVEDPLNSRVAVAPTAKQA
jgi:UDP-MurNAc hydroxylase